MFNSKQAAKSDIQNRAGNRNDWKRVEMRDRMAALGKIVGSLIVIISCLILIGIAAISHMPAAYLGTVVITGSLISLILLWMLVYNVEDWWQDFA